MASSSAPLTTAPFTLRASYTTATNTSSPFTITSPITSPATTAGTPLEQKTTYLRSLRAAVLDTQERINKELTSCMEADNARAAAAGTAVNDTKEEENYGEEMQEEDD